MQHTWQVAKLYFDWIPQSMPVDTRQDGSFLLVVPCLHPEVVYLNRQAAFVLEQCDGETTVLEIIKKQMVEFMRADRANVAWEVLKVLRQLSLRMAVDFAAPGAKGLGL